MFGVVRMGDFCTGHDCYPPRPPMTCSFTVFVNNLPVIRMGDIASPHCCPDEGCHPGIYIGCCKVFVEDRPIQKMADPICCGSMCMLSSFDTFVGN